jgi:hypothetical protein
MGATLHPPAATRLARAKFMQLVLEQEAALSTQSRICAGKILPSSPVPVPRHHDRRPLRKAYANLAS